MNEKTEQLYTKLFLALEGTFTERDPIRKISESLVTLDMSDEELLSSSTAKGRDVASIRTDLHKDLRRSWLEIKPGLTTEEQSDFMKVISTEINDNSSRYTIRNDFALSEPKYESLSAKMESLETAGVSNEAAILLYMSDQPPVKIGKQNLSRLEKMLDKLSSEQLELLGELPLSKKVSTIHHKVTSSKYDRDSEWSRIVAAAQGHIVSESPPLATEAPEEAKTTRKETVFSDEPDGRKERVALEHAKERLKEVKQESRDKVGQAKAKTSGSIMNTEYFDYVDALAAAEKARVKAVREVSVAKQKVISAQSKFSRETTKAAIKATRAAAQQAFERKKETVATLRAEKSANVSARRAKIKSSADEVRNSAKSSPELQARREERGAMREAKLAEIRAERAARLSPESISAQSFSRDASSSSAPSTKKRVTFESTDPMNLSAEGPAAILRAAREELAQSEVKKRVDPKRINVRPKPIAEHLSKAPRRLAPLPYAVKKPAADISL